MNTTDNKTNYATSEFPLAATLVCMNIALVGLRPSADDVQRIEFLFNKDEIIEKLISGYWEGSLRIEPKHFWGVCRELKSRLKN